MTAWLVDRRHRRGRACGLAPAARTLVDDAEVLIGGAAPSRHGPGDRRGAASHGRRRSPSSSSAFPRCAAAASACSPAATRCTSASARRLSRVVPPEEMTIVPRVSAFSLAAARLAWPLEKTALVSLHGLPGRAARASRRARRAAPDPGARRTDRRPPSRRWLVEHGFGESRMIALAHMGGANAARLEARRRTGASPCRSLHTLAVECVAGPDARWFPRSAGPRRCRLRERRQHDQARVPRARHRQADAAPRRAACGTSAAAADRWRSNGCARRTMREAIALEPNPKRRAIAARNAAALGVPALDIRAGRAPEALADLPSPTRSSSAAASGPPTLAAAIEKLKPAAGSSPRRDARKRVAARRRLRQAAAASSCASPPRAPRRERGRLLLAAGHADHPMGMDQAREPE